MLKKSSSLVTCIYDGQLEFCPRSLDNRSLLIFISLHKNKGISKDAIEKAVFTWSVISWKFVTFWIFVILVKLGKSMWHFSNVGKAEGLFDALTPLPYIYFLASSSIRSCVFDWLSRSTCAVFIYCLFVVSYFLLPSTVLKSSQANTKYNFMPTFFSNNLEK